MRPGLQAAYKFIPNVFDGVEGRALCRPVKFFHTDLNKLFLYGPHFVHRDIVMLKQEKAFPKQLPQSWKHKIIYNVIVCCSFKISINCKQRAEPEP
jgi:hypothetical protein